jgi:hypothetical protein
MKQLSSQVAALAVTTFAITSGNAHICWKLSKNSTSLIESMANMLFILKLL